MPDPTGAIHDRIVISNETKNLVVVREFITRMVGLSPLRPEDVNRVILAVDEAVTNIIEHAYRETRSGTVEVDVTSDQDRITILIRDSGKKFDPDEIDTDFDVEARAREGKRNGLGLLIIRQIMDEVVYRFKECVQNELRLVKYIR